MKHAPGPWRSHHQYHDDIVDYHGTLTASCYGHPDTAEVKANARLIAAAPDLLKALKDMVALVDAIKDGPHKLDFRGGEYSDAVDIIAKAEGMR